MGTIEFHTTIKNGVIEIPAKYRNKVKDRVRVLLFPEGEKNTRPNLIDQLLEKPICLTNFRPIKRDDLYER